MTDFNVHLPPNFVAGGVGPLHLQVDRFQFVQDYQETLATVDALSKTLSNASKRYGLLGQRRNVSSCQHSDNSPSRSSAHAVRPIIAGIRNRSLGVLAELIVRLADGDKHPATSQSR